MGRAVSAPRTQMAKIITLKFKRTITTRINNMTRMMMMMQYVDISDKDDLDEMI